MAVRTRAIAARAALVLGIAAIVVAGGLLAGLRGGGASTTPQAAPSAVRATLDPVTSLTGDATQVSELQSRPSASSCQRPPSGRSWHRLPAAGARDERPLVLHEGARRCSPLAEARPPRARRHDRHRARWRCPTTISATRCASGKRALALSHGFSPPALAIIGDASIELGRYHAGLRDLRQAGPAAPGPRRLRAAELRARAAGRRRGRDATHAPRRRSRLGRAREHPVDARATGGPAAQVGQHRRRRQGVPPRARTAARTTRAPRPASAPSRSRAAISPRPSSWYERAASHLPLPDIVAALGDVRQARGNTAGAKEAYALVRVENALFIRAGGNADLEPALFDASHPGTPRAPAVVALGAQGTGLPARPSTATTRSRWALYAAGKCRQALPQAQAREPPRHGRSAALVAPGRDRRLRREARPRTRARSRKALARKPRFHPLDAPAARRLLESALVEPGHAAPARRRAGRARLALAALVPAAGGAPARQLHGQPVHAPRPRPQRTSPCATCSTWRRSRPSSVARSSTPTATAASRRPRPRARARRLIAIVAPHLRLLADGRPGAARARVGARRLPARSGRPVDDPARRALPRSRAEARRCTAHVHALEHATPPIAWAGASSWSREAAASPSARPTHRSAIARARSRTTRLTFCTRRPTSAPRPRWQRSDRAGSQCRPFRRTTSTRRPPPRARPRATAASSR